MEAGIEAVEALVRPARPEAEALGLGYEKQSQGGRSKAPLVPVPRWTPRRQRLETASQVKQKPQDGPWGCFVARGRTVGPRFRSLAAASAASLGKEGREARTLMVDANTNHSRSISTSHRRYLCLRRAGGLTAWETPMTQHPRPKTFELWACRMSCS